MHCRRTARNAALAAWRASGAGGASPGRAASRQAHKGQRASEQERTDLADAPWHSRQNRRMSAMAPLLTMLIQTPPRSISCIFCHCRRGRDHCGPPWGRAAGTPWGAGPHRPHNKSCRPCAGKSFSLPVAWECRPARKRREIPQYRNIRHFRPQARRFRSGPLALLRQFFSGNFFAEVGVRTLHQPVITPQRIGRIARTHQSFGAGRPGIAVKIRTTAVRKGQTAAAGTELRHEIQPPLFAAARNGPCASRSIAYALTGGKGAKGAARQPRPPASGRESSAGRRQSRQPGSTDTPSSMISSRTPLCAFSARAAPNA